MAGYLLFEMGVRRHLCLVTIKMLCTVHSAVIHVTVCGLEGRDVMNNVDSGCFLDKDVQISSAGVLVTLIDAHTRCHYDFHVQFCAPFGAWVAQLVSD